MIFYGQEIIFDEIVIDGLVVYFDRRTTSLTENSLNLWAAIGVTNKESEKWFFRAFVKSILMAIKNRIRKNTSIVHMLKLDRLKRREKAAFSADSDDDDDDDDDGDKSSMNSEDVIQSPADGTIGRGASENSLASALESLPAGESMQEGSFTQLSSKPFSTSSSATASSLRRSRQRFGTKKGIDATLPTPTPTPVQRLPTVEFNHLIIYDLVAYPLDLLTETHSEHVFKDNSKIYLKKFTLDRDDITGKPLTKNGPRVPLPADDFGDKFGDAFGGALVKHNTYQIASIFAHSYANRILKIKAKEKRHSHAGIQKEVNNSMNPLLSSQSSSIVIGKVVAISDPVTEQST